ncbi:MAG: fibronectin type III domain-containing protein [Bacteroidales bacterium]|nr:fibronectin type III domain-containing protein [Bacteroidales bacterium]
MKRLYLLLFSVMMLFAFSLHAQNTCAPPTNLTAALHMPDWNNVQLSWTGVEDTSAEQLSFCTTYSTRIGADAAADFIGAIRFEPTHLTPITGMKLTSVSFVPGEAQSICTYYVMVWQGGSLVNDSIFSPGTLIANKQVAQMLTTSVLNTVMLDTALLIDPTQELWIGIRCNTSAGFPLGASQNGGDFNNGDLINFGGWETLSNGDPTSELADFNWMIIGTFQDPNNLVSSYKLYRDNALISSSMNTGYLDSVAFGTYQYDVIAEYETGCQSSPITTMVTMAENPCIDCMDSIFIGSGTTSQYILPLNTFYNYSYTQQIFTASELGVLDGTIPCIAFQYIHSSPQDKNIVVYMGNTDKSSFSGSTDWVPMSDLQQVFSGVIPFATGGYDNWVNIPLDVPFEYDGSSNIVLAVLNNTGTYVTSSDNTFTVHTASNKTLYVYQDGSAYTPATSTPSGTVSSNRNNVRFMVGPPPACATPTHLSVSNVTSNGADLNWDGHDNASGFELVVVPEGSSLYNETPISIMDTFYTLTSLTDNTVYTVYLRANCSPDNSNWKIAEFHTSCIPATTIPYVANFDNMGTGTAAFPDCWERGLGGTAGNYPYISSSYAHSGNGSLYFYSYTPNSAVARGQGLDLTNNYQPLVMSLYAYKTSSNYGRMEFGYMTDATDFSTFVSVKSIYPMDMPLTTWTEYKFALPESVNGQVIYPVVYCPYAPGSYSNYVYIDDVTIDYGDASCMAAENLEVSNVSYTSALISWQPSSSDVDYVLAYTNESTEMTTTLMVTGETSQLLTGLDTMTTYTVALYPNCFDIPDTLFATFTTHTYEVISCLSPDTNAQETTSGSSSTSYQIPVNNFYNYTYSQQIYTPSELGGATVITGIAFEYSNASAMTVKSNVSIYLAHKADSTFASTTDWVPISQAVKVYEGALNCQQGWNTFDFTEYFSYNGIDNLVLIVLDNSGDYNSSSYTFNVHTKNSSSYSTLYAYRDSSPYDATAPGSASSRSAMRNDVKFFKCSQTQSDYMTCPAPNVIVTDYDSASVTLQWAAGNAEAEWLLEYKMSGDATWTSLGSVTNTNTFTVDNLLSDTEYDFRMCALCSTSDSSEWVEVSAATTCGYLTIPYFEDFESATSTGSSYMLPCWTRGTNYSTQYPYISGSQANSGTKSLYFYGSSTSYSYAATPRFADEVAMDSLNVTFELFKTSTDYFIEAGIMTDPNDFSTFEVLGTFSPENTYSWENFELNTSNYSGNGHYLAFRIPAWGSSYAYLDDLSVMYVNPCSHPTNIAIQDLGGDYAELTWTPGGEEVEWEYVYDVSGNWTPDNMSTSYATTNSAYLTGLTPNTSYDFYVRAVCSGSESSNWEQFSFYTQCTAITTLPYTENFDSLGLGTTNLTTGPSNLPNCWEQYNTASSSYTAYPYVYYSSSYAASGNYALRFYSYTSSSYGDEAAMLPLIDTMVIPMNTLQLTFNVKTYSSYPFYLIVGTVNGSDFSTFEPLDTLIYTNVSGYTEHTVFLNNYTGHGNRFAFLAPNVGGPITSYNAGTIDDVVISLTESCPHPSHLSIANVGSTSVTLGWTENGSATAWYIEYGQSGFTPGSGTVIDATSNPFVVDNLSTSVSYDFYVRSDCSGDTSSYSNLAQATPGSYLMPMSGSNTVTTCSMVVYDDGGLQGSYSNSCNSTLIIYPEVAGNMISLYGTVSTESCCDYVQIYDGAGTSGNMLGEYRGSGLTVPTLVSTTGPLTIYFHSDGSVTYEGFVLTVNCYSNTCPPPTDLTFTNLGTTTATVSWTPAGTETAWVLEYKTASATTWTPLNVTSSSYSFTGLTPLTTYDVRVKADCGTEESFYLTGQFTTPACEASEQCNYIFNMSDAFGDGWNGAYITIVQNGATVATVGQSFTDGTSTSQTVALCDNIATSLVWNVGDYDSECSFAVTDPTGNIIFTTTGTPSGTLTTFTTDCSGATSCAAPTGLAVNNVTQTTATASWTAGGTETSWTVEYKATSASTWQSATANATSYTMTGLTASTAYQVRVKAVCDANTSSEWSTVASFTTLDNGTPTCPAPTNLAATVDHTDVTLTWQQEANTATEWQINYRQTTESNWSTVTATTTTYTLTDLVANVTYEANVVAHCSNGLNSDPSNTVTFETNNNGVQTYLEKSVNLYPNPATEIVSVAVSDANIQISSVEVYNVYGQLINVIESNDNPLRIDVSGLADGMYYVRVTTDGGVVTKNFVKR